jgi:hypothetical protein
MLMVESFHCLFCHGYEERGAASAGVFAIDELCAKSLCCPSGKVRKPTREQGYNLYEWQ